MLSYPFFGCENHKLFTDFVKDRYFIFAIFESKFIGWKIELLHAVNVGRKQAVVKRLELRTGYKQCGKIIKHGRSNKNSKRHQGWKY